MNIITTDLRNKMGDIGSMTDKKIMLCFHCYKERRVHLPRQFHLPGINTT
jgi:hypothetical protein